MRNDPRIPEVCADMEKEMGEGNKKPEILAKLAQYELTLLDWVEEHKGYTQICSNRRTSAGLHSRHSSDAYLAM